MSTPIATSEARVFEASPTSRWIGACTAPVVAYALYVVASQWGSERAGLAVFWTGMFFRLWLDTFRDSVVRAELRGDALLVGRFRRRLIKLADIVRLRVSTTGHVEVTTQRDRIAFGVNGFANRGTFLRALAAASPAPPLLAPDTPLDVMRRLAASFGLLLVWIARQVATGAVRLTTTTPELTATAIGALAGIAAGVVTTFWPRRQDVPASSIHPAWLIMLVAAFNMGMCSRFPSHAPTPNPRPEPLDIAETAPLLAFAVMWWATSRLLRHRRTATYVLNTLDR